jgi:hypothetical protein
MSWKVKAMTMKASVLMLALTLGPISSWVMAQQTNTSLRRPDQRSTVSRPDAASKDRKQALLAKAVDLESQRKVVLDRLDRSLAETQQAEKALRAEEQRVSRGAAARSRLRPFQVRVTRGQAFVETARRQLAENTYRLKRLRDDMQQAEGGVDHRGALLLQALAEPSAPATPSLEATADGSLMLRSGGDASAYYRALTPALHVQPAWEGMLAHDETEAMRAAADLRSAEARLQVATDALNSKKRLVEQGLAPTSDIHAVEADFIAAKSNVQSSQYHLAQTQRQRQRTARLATLQRPINVELRNATVQQAAESISQASGMPVHVDAKVSPETRLSVVARGVPMSMILDSIARKSSLLIHPHESGIALRPAPSLEVNGQRTELMSPNAPWSSEWGMNPSGSSGYGFYRTQVGTTLRDALVAAGGGAETTASPEAPSSAGSAQAPGAAGAVPPPVVEVPDTSAGAAEAPPAAPSDTRPGVVPRPDRKALTPVPGRPAPPTVRMRPTQRISLDNQGRVVYEPMAGTYVRVLTPGGAPGSVAVTALSESSFVVAHPSVTPGGEPAVMLTVYRLDGSRLRVVSTTEHRLSTAAGRRSDPTRFPQEPYGDRPRSTAPVAPRPGDDSSLKPSQPTNTPRAR